MQLFVRGGWSWPYVDKSDRFNTDLFDLFILFSINRINRPIYHRFITDLSPIYLPIYHRFT